MVGRGWTLVNAPAFGAQGMTLNGTTQYATIPTSRMTAPFLGGAPNEISFVVTFIPTFAAAEAVNRAFYDGVAPNRYIAYRDATAPNYNLYFYAGATTLVGTVAIAAYGGLWLVGQRNQIVAALRSGANVFYLNGAQIGTSAVVWSKLLLSSLLYSGCATAGTMFFAGTLSDRAIFGRQLTPAEVSNLWNVGTL